MALREPRSLLDSGVGHSTQKACERLSEVRGKDFHQLVTRKKAQHEKSGQSGSHIKKKKFLPAIRGSSMDTDILWWGSNENPWASSMAIPGEGPPSLATKGSPIPSD